MPFTAAGENLVADSNYAGVAEAPHRAGAIVGRFVGVQLLLDLHYRL
jgi:hypothetical protein